LQGDVLTFLILKTMGSVITVNGKTIISSGNNVVISGNKILIDFKDVTPDAKTISVQITGNVEKIEVDCCESLNISGDCNTVSSHNGSIDIGGSVKGSVTNHNGNIECQNVGGSVTTRNGNIKHRK
jgi:hypothetical protein